MKKKYLMRINFYYWIIENEKQNMKKYGSWALQQTLKQRKCYMSICDLKAGSIFSVVFAHCFSGTIRFSFFYCI